MDLKKLEKLAEKIYLASMAHPDMELEPSGAFNRAFIFYRDLELIRKNGGTYFSLSCEKSRGKKK